MARYGCTITVQTAQIPSSQSNFAWVATEANFPTAAKDGGAQSILNGGGNLRCYVDSTKSTQLPVAIVKFVTGGTPDIQVFGKSPTLAVGSTVYVEADTVATTQPAVTDTYGRNAVFSEYVSAYVGDDGTDFAGNFDLTSSGTGSISSTTNDSNMSGISFDGAVSLKNTSWTKLVYPLSFSMWGYRDPAAGTQAVISQGDPSGAAWDSLLIRAGDRYEINTNNGSNRANTTSIPDNMWDYVTVNIDTDDFEIIVDTVVRGAGSSGTQATGSMTEFALGELVRSASALYYEGDLSAVLVKDSAISADEHESLYNNQSAPSSFWSTSAWEDQDAGGAITVSDTTSNTNSSNNVDSVVLVGAFNVSDSVVNSLSQSNTDSITLAALLTVSDSTTNSNVSSNTDTIKVVGEFTITEVLTNSNSVSNNDSVNIAASVLVSEQTSNSNSSSNTESIKLVGEFSIADAQSTTTTNAGTDNVSFASIVAIADNTTNSNSLSNSDSISFVGQFNVDDFVSSSSSISNADTIQLVGKVNVTGSQTNTDSASNSDTVLIGTFAFNVNDETNISALTKSRNISALTLSTNINAATLSTNING